MADEEYSKNWYNRAMRNWSTDTKNLSKHPAKYQKFMLESIINFGTGGQKIKGALLKKELNNLDIDPKKKEYLTVLIS